MAKINVTCLNKEDFDYTIHSILVQKCTTKNLASRLINKTLNKKFEDSIKVFRPCKDSAELLALWQDAFSIGNIPGPYWAVLSHPHLNDDVGAKIFSNVLMLSYLVASSNHTNIVRINELEIELANTHDKIKKLIFSNNVKLMNKTDIINAQEEKIIELNLMVKIWRAI